MKSILLLVFLYLLLFAGAFCVVAAPVYRAPAVQDTTPLAVQAAQPGTTRLKVAPDTLPAFNHLPKPARPNYFAGKNYSIGARLGIAFARAINSSGNIISSPNTGLLAAIFLQRGLRLFGTRTEVNYSRQGFSYNNSGQIGHIRNDYLSLLTLSTLTILHRVQLQFGTQEGYLLSSTDSNGPGTKGGNPITAMNRFDFGLAGGVEVYPHRGVLVGFRYNLGLTNLIKRQDNSVANYVPFYQIYNGFNVKNGVFQVFAGYQLPL